VTKRWGQRDLRVFTSRAVTAAVAGVSLVVASSPAAFAGTGSGGGVDWSVTVTVPDFTYTQHGCEDAPVLIQAAGNIDGSWVVDVDVFRRGSGVPTWSIYEYGYDSLTGSDSAYLCPWSDGPGVYDVIGTVEAGWDGASAPVSLSFNVRAMPTSAALTSAVTDGQYETRFQGRVTAASSALGTIGADPDGRVSLQAYMGGAWSEVEYTSPDQLGYFDTTAHRAIPAGTSVRAVYQGSGSTEASTSPSITVNGPQASVSVAKVGYGNKLFVDVDPNQGSGYWTFRVQKRNSDGSWSTSGTAYNTGGDAETKTLTLGAGVFRVVVDPRNGYGGATSAPVTLTAPTVAVAASRDRNRDKLLVDVNPNKGSGYWKFRVQQRTSTGSWKTLSTVYRTEGRKETKTVDLRKGTYRVKVASKYNYRGATSKAVTLKR
jgi:hypothetical protein